MSPSNGIKCYQLINCDAVQSALCGREPHTCGGSQPWAETVPPNVRVCTEPVHRPSHPFSVQCSMGTIYRAFAFLLGNISDLEMILVWRGGGWSCNLVVECLLSRQEAPGAIFSATHIKSHGRMCTGSLYGLLKIPFHTRGLSVGCFGVCGGEGMPWIQSPRIPRDRC